MSKDPLPPEFTKQEVCKRLVALRKALGLNQTQVVTRLGIGKTQWANYEKLDRMPNIADMMRVSREFAVPLDFIYMGQMDRVPHDLAVKIKQQVERPSVEPGSIVDATVRARQARLLPTRNRSIQEKGR